MKQSPNELLELQSDLEEITEKISSFSERAHDLIEPYIEDETWKVIAIAAGVGMIAALMFMNHSDE